MKVTISWPLPFAFLEQAEEDQGEVQGPGRRGQGADDEAAGGERNRQTKRVFTHLAADCHFKLKDKFCILNIEMFKII